MSPPKGNGTPDLAGMAGSAGRGALRLAAPWYVHPATDPHAWQRLLAGTSLSFAVVNADNGPAPDNSYYREVLSGGSLTPLLGYVDTAYGERPVELVLAEVRSWLESTPVCGIMLDCVPGANRQRHWDLGMIERIRDLGADLVVANPGMPPDPQLVLRADVTCVAEFDWAGFRDWEPPEYLQDLPPERMWMLAHDVPCGEQEAALELMAGLGAGLGWATAGTLPNPWATLPCQW